MSTPKPTVQSSLIRALLHTAAHAFAWLVVAVVLVFLSGSTGTMYQEFEMQLPVASQLFLSLAEMIIHRWYVFVPVVLILLAVDLGVLFLLDRSGLSRVVGVLWSAAIFAVTAILLLAILWALLAPLNQLMSDLS